ncbi:hypothetical protein ACWGCW_14565 [Streptomyces sp. NPDC054933]
MERLVPELALRLRLEDSSAGSGERWRHDQRTHQFRVISRLGLRAAGASAPPDMNRSRTVNLQLTVADAIDRIGEPRQPVRVIPSERAQSPYRISLRRIDAHLKG